MPEVVSRCKVYVENVVDHGRQFQTLNLRGVVADGVPENKRFNDNSPNITMQIIVSNPALYGAFRPGQRFYVDFTEAPDCPKE